MLHEILANGKLAVAGALGLALSRTNILSDSIGKIVCIVSGAGLLRGLYTSLKTKEQPPKLDILKNAITHTVIDLIEYPDTHPEATRLLRNLANNPLLPSFIGLLVDSSEPETSGPYNLSKKYITVIKSNGNPLIVHFPNGKISLVVNGQIEA